MKTGFRGSQRDSFSTLLWSLNQKPAFLTEQEVANEPKVHHYRDLEQAKH